MELMQQFQEYKGRVVFPGDAVKDDAGSSAVLMAAAKVLDDISRRLGSAGQPSGAVSACTRVKNGSDTAENFPGLSVLTFGYVYHVTDVQKCMAGYRRTSGSSGKEFVWTLFAGLRHSS